MYTQFFGLSETAFSITPDPRFLYMSPLHQEALAHLLYGTGEDGGFVQLTGEVGTGKTTLLRALLEQNLEQVDLALILNPRLTTTEFVATICDELGAGYPKPAYSMKPLVDALNAHLLETHRRGRQTVLVVDEAQNLSRDVLEQVRLLTNLETSRHKLLRIILVGQPELQRILAQHDMRQLAQRITGRYHLGPLSEAETAEYIGHRLAVAGATSDLFYGAAVKQVYRLSGGIPRLINIICDRALLGAYAQNQHLVGPKVVKQAAREALEVSQLKRPPSRLMMGLSGAMAMAVLALAGYGVYRYASHLGLAPSAPVVAESEQPETTVSELAMVAAVDTPSDTSKTDAAAAQPTPATDGPKPTPGAPRDTPAARSDAPPPPRADVFEQPLADRKPQAAVTPAAAPLAPPDQPAQKMSAASRSGQQAAGPAGNVEQTSAEIRTAAGLATELARTSRDTFAAYQALFGLWNEQIDQSDDSNPCLTAYARGMRCTQGDTTLAQLRAWNLPALIRLKDAQDRPHEVVLQTLHSDRAGLRLSGRLVELPLTALEPLWGGHAVVLWRLQTSAALISFDSRGKPVLWLRSRLDQVDGQKSAEATGAARFDEALEARVMKFQRDNGLQVDGIVGAQTMLLLNTLKPAPGTPALSTDQEAG